MKKDNLGGTGLSVADRTGAFSIDGMPVGAPDCADRVYAGGNTVVIARLCHHGRLARQLQCSPRSRIDHRGTRRVDHAGDKRGVQAARPRNSPVRLSPSACHGRRGSVYNRTDMSGKASTNGSPPLLLHAFATFAVGGAQMRFATLANAFGDRYRHIVVAMDGDHACARLLSPALDLRCEPIEAPKRATLSNVRRFRDLLRRFAPDLLVTYNWGAIEWAMANIPRLVRHVHVEDGFGPEERSAQIRRRVLTRRLVLARSTVILPSRNLRGIATDIWHLDPRRVHYVPNGIDLDRFAAGGRAPTGEPVIGTITGLRREKNLGRLLRAFRQVADTTPARLIIAGDGSERATLEAQAAGLGLGQRVQFTGHLDDPAPLYRSIDVFTLSSDTEQMPLSVLEAMAACLPVAATDVGDIASMVATENRPFITPLDETALATAIAALVSDPALRERVGAANRAKAVAEFGQVTMIAAWRTFFDGTATAA
jgi:glycosyltransferase involved in cell wall biosynthesis